MRYDITCQNGVFLFILFVLEVLGSHEASRMLKFFRESSKYEQQRDITGYDITHLMDSDCCCDCVV